MLYEAFIYTVLIRYYYQTLVSICENMLLCSEVFYIVNLLTNIIIFHSIIHPTLC